MPASSFHFGSGYTLHGGKRLTFQWNRHKFPQPEALIAAMHAAGLRVVANVKPCLLSQHPAYDTLTCNVCTWIQSILMYFCYRSYSL